MGEARSTNEMNSGNLKDITLKAKEAMRGILRVNNVETHSGTGEMT